MNIKYRIIYKNDKTPIKSKTKKIKVDERMCFVEFMDSIKNDLELNEYQYIYIEDLIEKTWGKVVSNKMINIMGLDIYNYEWLKYKLIDIQKMFKLFDDVIDIFVEELGLGGVLGEKEGIRFIIHSNEKDKHAKFPHVHCEYSGEEIFVYLNDQSLLNGKGFKNKKKTKIALKWIKENKNDLLNYWNNIIISNADIDFDVNI